MDFRRTKESEYRILFWSLVFNTFVSNIRFYNIYHLVIENSLLMMV